MRFKTLKPDYEFAEDDYYFQQRLDDHNREELKNKLFMELENNQEAWPKEQKKLFPKWLDEEI